MSKVRTLLQRGESMVASTGLALAAVLLAGLGGAGWLSFDAQQQALTDARRERVEAIGTILQDSATTMLAAHELTALRRIVSSIARSESLDFCRVRLPDGSIVAAEQPSAITTPTLPEKWSATWSGGAPAPAQEGMLAFTYPLIVPGRGVASLELGKSVQDEPMSYWQAMAGVGLVGAGMLGVLLLIYRRMRRRFRAIGAIQEALLALRAGETDDAALQVNAKLGQEAEAWNELLGQRADLKRASTRQKTVELMDTRRSRTTPLDAACDALWQGMILVDGDLEVIYANGAASVLLQRPRDGLVGRSVRDAFDDENVVAMIEGALVRSGNTPQTVQVARSSGDHDGVLRVNVRRMRSDDVSRAVVILEDVTQQCVSDKARNFFVAQATHELRAPLTNIRLYIETAIEDGEADPGLRSKCLNVINKESRRLERIVGDMLSVSEIEAGSLQLRRDDVRIENVFEDIRSDYVEQAKEKSISLSFDLSPKLPVISGDRDKVVLVLHNLIGNAIKYTPTGGRVKVRVDVEDGQLLVEVADTGIGIPVDDVPHVFDKFYRAKDPRLGEISGSGLGLALAREIVRLHGGDIGVDSELNKGSVFTVTFPVHATVA